MRLNIPQFTDKKDLIKYLVANKTDLIEFKKSTLKFSDPFEVTESTTVVKSLSTSHTDDIENGIIKRTIVGNTYNWLDSHGDVHVGNTFKKSIEERANKIFHLHDHLHQVTAKVGRFTSVYEKTVRWSDLGVNKAGETIILAGDSEIKKSMNPVVYEEYLLGEIDQHSVGMSYVKLDLAVNDKEYKEEYATWNKYFSLLGNPQEATNQGYFWAVSEAKLAEMSAVLKGSNTLTPTVQNIEPIKFTQSPEPSEDTQDQRDKELKHYYLTLLK